MPASEAGIILVSTVGYSQKDWPGRSVLRALSGLERLKGPLCVCSVNSFMEINEAMGNFLEGT